MAVIPEFQRKGIGGQLLYRSVIVLGHVDYYPGFGFVPAEKWSIRSPYEVPANVFMALELVPDGLENVSGLVKYPEFRRPDRPGHLSTGP